GPGLLRRLEVRCDHPVAATRGHPVTDLSSRDQPDAAGRGRLRDRHLGRLPDPFAQPVVGWHDHLLDDPRGPDLRALPDPGTAPVRPARPALADAGLGAATGQLLAVQMDVRFSD